MKYRDPTIRACRGTPKPVTIIRPAPAPSKPEPRVFREPPKRDRYDFLPGGLPPEPYRTPWRRVGLTGRGAREPFNSREVRAEHYATRAYLS